MGTSPGKDGPRFSMVLYGLAFIAVTLVAAALLWWRGMNWVSPAVMAACMLVVVIVHEVVARGRHRDGA